MNQSLHRISFSALAIVCSLFEKNNFSLGGDALKQIKTSTTTTNNSVIVCTKKTRVASKRCVPLVLFVYPLLLHALVCLLTYRIIFSFNHFFDLNTHIFYSLYLSLRTSVCVCIYLHTGTYSEWDRRRVASDKMKHSSNKQNCTRVG